MMMIMMLITVMVFIRGKRIKKRHSWKRCSTMPFNFHTDTDLSNNLFLRSSVFKQIDGWTYQRQSNLYVITAPARHGTLQ